MDRALKGKVFYYDVLHPDGQTGHRVMGELVAQLVLDAWEQVAAGPVALTAEVAESVNAPLIQPMLPNNFEAVTPHCLIGNALVGAVIHKAGFEWINEGKEPHLPKWGFVATEPGSELRVMISTKTGDANTANDNVIVELGFLRSYENVGRFMVRCIEGCVCPEASLDGLHEHRNSQTFLHGLNVSQAERCVISITVLPETSTGKHKVKITGVMVSEDTAAKRFENWKAWEVVIADTSRNPAGLMIIPEVAAIDPTIPRPPPRPAARRMLEELEEPHAPDAALTTWVQEMHGGAGFYSFLHA
ncbi:hypothetical protein HYH03_013207 [Edaphochlamys debaryana]|uniref:Uncharacterized protein n=1 Tax=Edaphochlamys debaryana TaxID=47281 RepID=A0A835XSK2_9CHLO|nr:hypothetical protein HYH03_013207 [Edaphochlamys debaryana]|eukprot:KAG2488213.1 hypothetical protein HYH03_013207 [Edaphochlamys debaryana]